MAFIGPNNRFNDFRDDFLRDTGLKNVEENMDLYIQYVIARFSDQNHRILTNLAHDIQDIQKALKKV